jgi:hypothetical protein
MKGLIRPDYNTPNCVFIVFDIGRLFALKFALRSLANRSAKKPASASARLGQRRDDASTSRRRTPSDEHDLTPGNSAIRNRVWIDCDPQRSMPFAARKPDI